MIDHSTRTRVSKLLSLVLRHEPSRIGITLDANGFVRIDVLLIQLAAFGEPIRGDELVQIVRDSDKQRFAISEDGERIRASQGHSIPVNLGLLAIAPPARLFHGTVARVLPSIRESGITPGGRTHVHLSADEDTAMKVARRRRGPHAMLIILSGDMHAAGHAFYLSDNCVWLAAHVPASFIQFPE